MDQSNTNQGQQTPPKDDQPSFDKDQPTEERGGQVDRDRSKADDRNRPEDEKKAIPELDEPDVEGVGNEGGAQSQGQRPITDNKSGG